MIKLRVYIDTSVISAIEDARLPDRQKQTREFWDRLPDFEPCTSEVAREELSRTSNMERRSKLLDRLAGLIVHPVSYEMRQLAERYVLEGVFAAGDVYDALHVAAAVMTRQDVLVSWNFRHLVNRRRRAMINALNVRMGLPEIDIIAPPEL